MKLKPSLSIISLHLVVEAQMLLFIYLVRAIFSPLIGFAMSGLGVFVAAEKKPLSDNQEDRMNEIYFLLSSRKYGASDGEGRNATDYETFSTSAGGRSIMQKPVARYISCAYKCDTHEWPMDCRFGLAPASNLFCCGFFYYAPQTSFSPPSFTDSKWNSLGSLVRRIGHCAQNGRQTRTPAEFFSFCIGPDSLGQINVAEAFQYCVAESTHHTHSHTQQVSQASFFNQRAVVALGFPLCGSVVGAQFWHLILFFFIATQPLRSNWKILLAWKRFHFYHRILLLSNFRVLFCLLMFQCANAISVPRISWLIHWLSDISINILISYFLMLKAIFPLSISIHCWLIALQWSMKNIHEFYHAPAPQLIHTCAPFYCDNIVMPFNWIQTRMNGDHALYLPMSKSIQFPIVWK